MFVTGYFTVERNIEGLSTAAIETALGFRRGRLDGGVRVLQLLRQPTVDEFELGGSTRYAGRKGLDATVLAPRRIPSAWTNQRLVKVDPVIPHSPAESYPPAPGAAAAEQWVLKHGVFIPARELCTLHAGQVYWRK